ncbi:glycosyltransferase family 4 protein [Allorhizobium sp. BGMRC 0089]|uniref:glycosyltransferase family 4 protein n=1 Tax=Allorhizobium sonneratiae TaxID=2934936 RepID=UPI0020339747|nr:glycosyltransferase family 4 protein [Allorhizobium sonneratiae]MCM2292140.1 glycosyltransferase family 4 protein [Allorhizobium sonneratiae]
MHGRRSLRIVHCFRSPVGGIFRHVRDLVEEQNRDGHAVGIVCDNLTGGPLEESLLEQVKPHLKLGLLRLPIRRSIGLNDIHVGMQFYRHVKPLQPDILHGHGAKGGALARIAGSLLRVKGYRVARFYSPHGGSLHYKPGRLSGKAVLTIERLLERHGDGLIFVCNFEAETYRRKIGAPRCATRVVYNGLRSDDFTTVEPASSDASAFVYIGMLRDLKGPDLFIDAFQLSERLLGRPLKGTIIGDGPDRDRYENTITKRGLGLRLRLLPAMPVRQAFAHGDIIVMPSRAEALPYLLLEAIAAGKSVIASRVGGIPEVLGEGSKAIVPPNAPEDLARTMVNALQQPDWKATTMPELTPFRQRFSATTMASDVLDFYWDSLQTQNR